MSWFQSTGLNAALGSLTESVQKATETVQQAIPAEHKDFLAKLTLNTEEMINERQNFREEARRKEEAKNRLGQLLPWETRDAEREILVEECKEAILELSKHDETFFGPYDMPMLNVQLEDDEEDDGEIVEGEGEEESGDAEDASGDQLESEVAAAASEEKAPVRHHYHMKPSEESKEKLAKLQPLPPLLEEFDLDSHVGLIQKLLKEDQQLVKMQATLSGGGPREKVFWKNYFFHCAFTRYEAGLSIDEIWSYQVQSDESDQAASSLEQALDGKDSTAGASAREEETVVFNGNGDGSPSEPHAGFQEMEDVMAADTAGGDVAGDVAGTDASLTALSEGSPNNGFELVDNTLDGGTGDPELDELEAEIARELED